MCVTEDALSDEAVPTAVAADSDSVDKASATGFAPSSGGP